MEAAVDSLKAERAAQGFPALTVAVIWRPFLLRPNEPLEGTPKAPNTPDNPRVGVQLKAAGAAAGIDFTGKTDRAPNTLLAHSLLSHVLDTEPQKQVECAIANPFPPPPPTLTPLLTFDVTVALPGNIRLLFLSAAALRTR